MAEINHLNSRGKTARAKPNYQALLTNVKPHILEKILNIFYLDFILFGYDISPFLDIVRLKYEKETEKKGLSNNINNNSSKI